MVRAEAPLFPERRLIARVTRSERVGNPPYGRTSFEFDCIDASLGEAGIEEALENPDILKPFAAVRVVTTEKVFLRRYGFVPKDGAWVDLEIRPRGAERGPIAFHAQLQADGYTVHSRGALGEARLVAEPDEPPKILSPLSASVPAAVALAGPVIAACGFPSGALVSR